MMERFFAWSMRAGSKIMFWAAIVTFVTMMAGQFTVMMSSIRTMTQDHYSGALPRMEVEQFVFAFATALSSAAFLFFGALVIDRMDRWHHAREGGE